MPVLTATAEGRKAQFMAARTPRFPPLQLPKPSVSSVQLCLLYCVQVWPFSDMLNHQHYWVNTICSLLW